MSEKKKVALEKKNNGQVENDVNSQTEEEDNKKKEGLWDK